MQAMEDAAMLCLRSNVSFPEKNSSSKTHIAMQTEALSRPIQFITCMSLLVYNMLAEFENKVIKSL